MQLKPFCRRLISEIIKNPIEFLFRDEIPTSKISKVYEIDSNRAYGDEAYVIEMLKRLKK